MAGNKTLDLTIRIAGKMDKSLLAAINGTQSRISDLSRNVSRVGTMGLAALGALTTGTVAAIASCTKEATTFENQMADVVKYVDGLADATGRISDKVWTVGEGGNGQTYAQNYAAMKDAILDLSTQIPYTAEDLTRLAAAAGQSGKSMDEITGGFLKDAAMWGKAMDISADQAGDWAAKWEVAFHMNHGQIMTLADQINYLGANNATTAAEIASVVNDAASLGQVAGIDPDATAAIGTAMLAMGVDAGRVGTSVKRIYTNISKGSSATKAMKEQWKELGFTAEGVAASMQKDGVGTMQKIFTAINQLPEERQVGQVVTFANTTVKPIIQDIFSFITTTVVPIILQTFTAEAPIISGIITNLGTAIMTVAQIIGMAIQTAMPVIQSVISVVMSIASVVIPALLAGYEAFSSGLTTIVTSIQTVFQGIIDFVTGVFTGNWQMAWQGVQDIFGGIFEGLGALVKTPTMTEIKTDVTALGQKVDAIEKNPGKRWDNIVWEVLKWGVLLLLGIAAVKAGLA